MKKLYVIAVSASLTPNMGMIASVAMRQAAQTYEARGYSLMGNAMSRVQKSSIMTRPLFISLGGPH
jgi:hypothetical protein